MTNRELDSLHDRWTAYQRLSHLSEHWYWRPGWGPGRRFYTWHLTFENQNALYDLVDRVQQALQVPGLDLVPLSGLHLTMQGLGFTDEVNGGDLIEIIDAARRLCAKLLPLELTLGPVDPDAEGVGLLVQPWAAVEELRSTLRTAIGCVWPTVPEASGGFRPHITVAYSGSAAPTQPILQRLVTLRELRPITVNITTASLIALHRDAREYQWDTVATVPLGLADRGL